jgi:hypothetical protein
VCNPQNPLGRTYSRETLLAYARFCEENDLHLVSDEIYAMSVYDNPGTYDGLFRPGIPALLSIWKAEGQPSRMPCLSRACSAWMWKRSWGSGSTGQDYMVSRSVDLSALI